MTKLIAEVEIHAYGTTYQPGDEFELHSADEARVLVALGRARLADDTPQTRALKAEGGEAATDEGEKKRSYKRRDMRAED